MPLFTPGTMISTPSGDRLVQELGTGDVVLNKRGVAVQIRWKGSATLNKHELYGNPHLHPIVFHRGSIAPGIPSRDTAFSQNLGIEASSCRAGYAMAMGSATIPTKKLINHRDVRPVEPITVTYIHIHFDRHEFIRANGAWVECYSPLDADNGAKRSAQKTELFYFFPELRDLQVDANPERPKPAPKPALRPETDSKGLWRRLYDH